MIYSAVHHPASKFKLNMKQFRAAGGIGCRVRGVYHVSHSQEFPVPHEVPPQHGTEVCVCVCGCVEGGKSQSQSVLPSQGPMIVVPSELFWSAPSLEHAPKKRIIVI